MESLIRWPIHPHLEENNIMNDDNRGNVTPPIVDDDFAEFDRLVDVNLVMQTSLSLGLNNSDTHFSSINSEVWQDMNKVQHDRDISTVRYMRGITSAPSSSSKITPQRVGSCDEYEVALLRSDAFTVEDHAASLSLDEDAGAQLDAGDQAPLDASFFTKFAINITPEEAFGIDGTGAGVGVGASYYDAPCTSSHSSDPSSDAAEQEEVVELNNRGGPRRKRKLTRLRAYSDLDAFTPLYSVGRRYHAVISGSSTGSSRRSDSDSIGSDDHDASYGFLNDGRESRGKRQSRGKYKCSRCGEQKNNHTCAVMGEIEITHSTGTQSDPMGFSSLVIEHLAHGTEVPGKLTQKVLAEGDRIVVCRPWIGADE